VIGIGSDFFNADEVSMSSEDFGLSVRSVAELSLIVSRGANSLLDDDSVPTLPTAAAVRSFWQSSRRLQQRWMRILDEEVDKGSVHLVRLERLAPRVFVCEMLVRMWSTVLASLDRSRGTEDLTVISRNVVNGFLQIRHRVLSELIGLSEQEYQRVTTMDRLRRRCDRWTDMMIGKLAIEHACFDFSFDPARARDFGEDEIDESTISSPVVEHLLSAGLRLNFLQHLPAEPIKEPEFASLMRAILSSIPSTSFRSDTALLQLQITAIQHRYEELGIHN
jgi:hypothetical protein